jgi:hypothetical protein
MRLSYRPEVRFPELQLLRKCKDPSLVLLKLKSGDLNGLSRDGGRAHTRTGRFGGWFCSGLGKAALSQLGQDADKHSGHYSTYPDGRTT